MEILNKKTPMGHVVVLGNEKGGSGKSTAAMHIIVGLVQLGHSVASIDVDIRQGTLSRYAANREKFALKSPRKIQSPAHYRIDANLAGAPSEKEIEKLEFIIQGARINHDVIVIDAPGSDSEFSRVAHSYADTLITPINDSLVDFDVLAHVDGSKMQILSPSHYSEMVWEQKKARAARDGGQVDWIVIRNRISSLDNHNARDIAHLLSDLSKRIGFRVVPGFSERVIFRELFLTGLTILDLKDAAGPKALTPSHIAARQEVQTIVNSISLKRPEDKVANG